MKYINDLADLGAELELNEDVMMIVTKDNCPMCQILFIRLQSMEAEGDIETPIVVHNMDKSGSFEDSKEIYDIVSTPTAIRYKDGKEVARASGMDLSPDKFDEMDTLEETN